MYYVAWAPLLWFADCLEIGVRESQSNDQQTTFPKCLLAEVLPFQDKLALDLAILVVYLFILLSP